MDWLSKRPEQIVDRAEPADLIAELRQMPELSAGAAKSLDFALCQWTLYALSRADDDEGIRDLDDLGALAMRALPEEDSGTTTYRVRWRAFRDLLEAKRLAIAGAESGKARALLHAEAIIERLAWGPVPQSELREQLGISPGRMSQVLGVMEEGRLVERRRRGKENIVSLAAGTAPRRMPSDVTRAAAETSRARRPLEVFVRDAHEGIAA